MKRRLSLILLLLTLLVILGFGYLWATPRLEGVDPAPEAQAVPASAVVRLAFSRPMQSAAVIQRLSIEPARPGSFHWEDNTLVFIPSEPWPNRQTIRVRLEAGAPAASFPALPISQEHTWSFTIRQARLSYLFPSDGPAEIYTLDLQTGEIQRLTDGTGQVLDYCVAHTGGLIYYSASLGASGSAIYRLDLLSGESAELLDCPQALCRYPQVSPDGQRLAYERVDLLTAQGSRSQVWLLELFADGQGAPTLAGDPENETHQPTWSPDGRLAYYDFSQAAFIVMDLQSGESVSLPSQTGIPGAWSPDGRRYVITEIFANTISDPNLLPELSAIPSSHLLSFNTTDGSLQDLTVVDNVEDTSPAFSPDGERLAFARKYLDIARWTPGRQFWLMEADGNDQRPLLQDPDFNYSNFAWSPLGERLAFVRFNEQVPTDPPQIWLINADGNGAQQLITAGYDPQWIP